MIRRVLLCSAVMVFCTAAPAEAFFTLAVDSTTQRGRLTLVVFADPSVRDVVLAEDGRVFSRPEPTGQLDSPEQGPLNVIAVAGVKTWRCARRTRRFTATATDGAGAALHAAYTARTPSCASRLELRARPGTVTVRDTFGLGGMAARLCFGDRCRTVVLPRGSVRRTLGVPVRRGDRVTLRTRFQRTRLRVGARGSGGPVILTTGDSLMQNLQVVLADRLGRRARVTTDAKPGATLTDSVVYESWLEVARDQVARLHPRATVVFLGTNDVLPMSRPDGTRVACCGDDWGAEYERRARIAMRTYAQDGAGSVVWLTVPFNRDVRRRPAERAVNAALRRAAVAVRGVVLVPADAIFTPGERFRASMPDHGGRMRVREPDGVHLSLAGSRIAARFVVAALAGVLP